MIDPGEVRSVTKFQRNIKEYVGQLKGMNSPLVLNAASYQELLDRLEHVETLAAIQQGVEEIERGEGIPLPEAEARLRLKHGFSR
jgi:hypothetical protein